MFWLLISIVFAQDVDETNIVYKKKTEIDFEGIEIEGQLIKPDGSIITERQQATFNPLIRLRTEFSVEMSNSVKEIK